MWRCCSCLGHSGSGNTRYLGGGRGGVQGSRKYSALEGYGNQYWPIRSNVLAWRTPLPHRETWQATVHRAEESWTRPKQPCAHRRKIFLPVAALPQWELSVKVAQLLGLRGPWWRQVCRDMICLCGRSYGPIRVFSRASGSWWSEGLFGCFFSIAPPVQTLTGLPCLGSFSVVRWVRHIKQAPGWGPALWFRESGAWWARPSIVQLRMLSCRGREAMVMLHPLHVTQQYNLASMAAWFSSTCISHHDLLPHIPSIHLSAVNSSPHPGIAPQSLNSSSQPLHLPGDLCGVYGPWCVWVWQGLSDSYSFRLPQVSCFTLSLKYFSSDSDNCPNVGIGHLLQFPHSLRAGLVLLILLFFPQFLHPTEFWKWKCKSLSHVWLFVTPWTI